MKKIFFFFLLNALILSVFPQVVVKKSNDIIEVLGRKYYVHTVKKGETLYSISKVYGVPQSDILKINKEVVTNLKAGDILRIPVVDENYKPEPVTKITFIEYKVTKRKESLFSIAKKFGVSQDQIIKYNPQITNGLKKGMIIKIPQFEQENIGGEDTFFIYYQVKAGENLQEIARKYKTTPEEITEFNPQAKNGIKPGDILAIPKKHFTEDEKYILLHNQEKLPDFIRVDPNYFEADDYPPCFKFAYNKNMTFKISILLPLFVERNYPLSSQSALEPENIRFYDKSSVFYDYLLGTLLALFDLEQEGFKLKVHIYDTKADSNVVKQILTYPDVKKSDLIIGPVYYYNYAIVRRFSKRYRINVISPLTKKTSILKNSPFVFKVNPSDSILIDRIIRYISNQDTAKVYLIDDQSLTAQKINDQIVKYGTNYFYEQQNKLNYSFIPFSKFYQEYKKNISPDTPAIVIVPYKDEIKVTSVLNSLNALVSVDNYSITVFGFPEWQNFRNIDPVWISNLKIHYPSPFYTDIEDPEVSSFIKRFTALFHKKPTIYAFGGYDITFYFVKALKRYGKYFQFCLSAMDPEPNPNGIFLNFDFKRLDKFSGFENTGIFMIYYDKDLVLRKVQE